MFARSLAIVALVIAFAVLGATTSTASRGDEGQATKAKAKAYRTIVVRGLVIR